MKITLSQPQGGFNLAAINQNFQAIQDEFNNKVLYRQNPSGEPNQMVHSNLDMNNNHILNLPAPLSSSEPARLKDVQDAILGANTAVLTSFEPYKNISADNVQGAIEQVEDALVSTQQSLDEILHLSQYAAADGTDQYNNIMAWINAVMTTGKKGFISGTYKSNSPIVIDLQTYSRLGFVIEGSGSQRAVLDLTGVTSGVPFQIVDGNGGTGGDIFYGVLRDFGIKTNYAGVGVQFGKEDFSDALNSMVIDNLVINNNSTSASACAVEFNYVLASYINIVANCSGLGDAIRLRQTQFSTIRGAGGSATNAMHLTAGYNFGNTIIAFDYEVVVNCINIDNAQSTDNTFLGGQLVWTTGYGVTATAGSNNRIIGANFGIGTNRFGSTTGVICGEQGIGTERFGAINASPLSGDGAVAIDSPTGNGSQLVFRRNGANRWSLQRNNSTDTGVGNTGSNLILTRYNDAGAAIDNPVSVDRATGNTTITGLSALTLGFFGAGVQSSRPVVSGSRSGGAALTSLIGALSSLGLITDSTVS